ncbi:hypothetical protein SeMB42_g05558 [Synchytrium endobioticum]|uniref:START domain-containing protein n=1 Tax=Synchytrium endobioticum TaxID=286115 RepID=A0A507CQQ3_9FUNG|nr:hypothetical protein SeLEV6574_g06508 [Synchytrium endobioticum]TPX41464.1 hypothetical protein SeMB42_g05558 [Synchytrium endobioticum]
MAEPIPKPLTVLMLLAAPFPILYIVNLSHSIQLDSLHYILAEIVVIALLYQYLGLPNVSVLLDQLLGGGHIHQTPVLTTTHVSASLAPLSVPAVVSKTALPVSTSPFTGGPSTGTGKPRQNQYPGVAEAMVKQFQTEADAVYPDAATNPWSLVASVANPLIQVYKKSNTDFCFKVVVEIEATPETIFDTLADIDHRREWDEMCENAGVVDNVDAHTKVQYMKTKGVFPAAPRDAVVLAYVGKLPDGRYINVTKSVEHDAVPPFDNTPANTIRMQVKIAGQIVAPAPDKPGFTWIVQIADGDLKGWLPKSVVSFVATKAVPAGFIALQNMMRNIPRKETSYTIEMADKGQLPKISFGPKNKIGKLYYHDDGDTATATATTVTATSNGTIANVQQTNGTANEHVPSSATVLYGRNTKVITRLQ